MKLQGILGGGTGKLGESVFTNNAGRTIVRQYNPHVRNPRTARQQNSRSRFKMASELAKDLSLALQIGMPRIGAITSRNRFTSKVIPVAAGVMSLNEGNIVVAYDKVPVSLGGMPDLKVTEVSYASTNRILTVTMEEAYNPESKGWHAPTEGAAGLVVVLFNHNTGEHLLKQTMMGTSANVQIPELTLTEGEITDIYMFAKWVPTAHNDILSEQTPWKFPSDQSKTEYKPFPTM